MARLIKVSKSKELFANIVNGFAEWLSKEKMQNGKLSYSLDVGKVDRKATVTFTSVAWLKMQYLIAVFTTECGWNMVCRRSDDAEDEYIIEDIIIYPQVVSSATVDTDLEAYAKWEDGLDDDVYTNLCGHGHSHVNMGVTPSSTDLEHQNKRLAELGEDRFYIFTIWNKKGDRNWRIFDYKKNILFETGDVEVQIESDNGIFDFMEDVKTKITEKKYSSVSWNGGKYNGTKTATGAAAASTAPTVWAQTSSWTRQAWDYDEYESWR